MLARRRRSATAAGAESDPGVDGLPVGESMAFSQQAEVYGRMTSDAAFPVGSFFGFLGSFDRFSWLRCRGRGGAQGIQLFLQITQILLQIAVLLLEIVQL